MAALAEVTADSFQREVLEHVGPVLVDFWAAWCGPCKAIAPILEAIATEQTGLKIVKLNIDEYGVLASRYGVMSIPTLLVFQGGQVVKQLVGAKPKATLLAELADYLG